MVKKSAGVPGHKQRGRPQHAASLPIHKDDIHSPPTANPKDKQGLLRGDHGASDLK